MTASFSLRLRLKVYSFKMCLSVWPSSTPQCSDQLFRKRIYSAAGSPSALGQGLGQPRDALIKCCPVPVRFAHQRSWMTRPGLATKTTHHVFFNYAAMVCMSTRTPTPIVLETATFFT